MKNDQKKETPNHILLQGVVLGIPGLIVMVIISYININDMVLYLSFIPFHRYASNNANGCNSKVVKIANTFTDGSNDWNYY